MLLYTSGLEYDDRIRKEILTLQNHIPGLKFKIFAVLPENTEKEGITDYGVEYKILHLTTRDKYSSGKKTLLKAYDFYRTVKPELKDFDIVWCADVETFMFPLLLPRSTKLVWDQHEIPSPFLSNGIMKRVFRYMEKKCDIMYHANQPRIDYLKECGLLAQADKHVAIRNYPENLESDVPVPDEKFSAFKEWLGDRKCAYVQGVSSEGRKCYETLTAVLRIPSLCAVVVGSVDRNSLQKVKDEFGEEVNKRIFFIGKIPQKNTKLYMRECIVSLVFYATDQPNNIYCEPNRMFQSIMMGVPVIVGNNPSMKDVVDKYGVGISLNNDGSNIASITEAIDKIFGNYSHYKTSILNNREKLCWDHQEELLVTTFKNKVLNQ